MKLPTASKLELVEKCAASWVLPQTPEAYESADDGNALHNFAQAVASGQDVETARALLPIGLRERADDVARVLPEWVTLAPSEPAYAWDSATDTGRFLGVHLGRKYDVRPTEIAGAADWAGPSSVLDLKTGRVPPQPAARNAQLALLALARARAEGLESVEVATLHVPPYGRPVLDSHVLDWFALQAAAERFREVVERLGLATNSVRAGKPPYIVTGSHCRYCRAIESCPRSLALLRATRDELAAEEAKAIAKAHDGDVLALRDFATMAKALSERARYVAENIAKQRAADGRPVLTADGREWRPVTTMKRALDGRVVYQALADMHGGEVALRAVKLEATQTSVKAALQDGVERAREAWKAADGERGRRPTAKAALAEVMARVETLGGVVREPVTTMEEVAPGAAPTEESEGPEAGWAPPTRSTETR